LGRTPTGIRAGEQPHLPHARTLVANRLGMRTRDGAEARVEPSRLDPENHSIRRPDIAREITSCWISLVPSKIVWITLSEFEFSTFRGGVAVTRHFANRRFRLVPPIPGVCRDETRDGPIFGHFDFATSLLRRSHRRDALVNARGGFRSGDLVAICRSDGGSKAAERSVIPSGYRTGAVPEWLAGRVRRYYACGCRANW
jgi:hypothetical protein